MSLSGKTSTLKLDLTFTVDKVQISPSIKNLNNFLHIMTLLQSSSALVVPHVICHFFLCSESSDSLDSQNLTGGNRGVLLLVMMKFTPLVCFKSVFYPIMNHNRVD